MKWFLSNGVSVSVCESDASVAEDAPEFTLVAIDPLGRTVQRCRLQNHNLHADWAVATGTGHVTLPITGNPDINVGQDELAVRRGWDDTESHLNMSKFNRVNLTQAKWYLFVLLK